MTDGTDTPTNSQALQLACRQHADFGEVELRIDVEINDDDVGGPDVSLQQAPLAGTAQRFGNGGDDWKHQFNGHARRIAFLQELSCVGAVELVHCDSKSAPPTAHRRRPRLRENGVVPLREQHCGRIVRGRKGS